MITCLTPPINDTTDSATIVVQYDAGTTRQLASQTFTYYDNPVVSDVTPRNSYRRYYHVIIPRRLSGEYCKYSMGQKNGLHAFGNNSAEREPIWMKFGTL